MITEPTINDLFEGNQSTTSLSKESYESYRDLNYFLTFATDLIDKGYTINKLLDLYDKHLVDEGGSFLVRQSLERRLKILFNQLNNIELEEDKIIEYNLKKIIDKYNLADINQLANKINELISKDDIIINLINKINTAYGCQKVDINSFSTFIIELVNNMAAYASQSSNNQMFVNLNNMMNENASLKAENEQLKIQLASLGCDNTTNTIV